MGLNTQYSNYRFFKRSRRLKGRPQWQDQVPEEKPARDTYRIAAKYQSRFSRAFLAAVREFLPDRMPFGFKSAYNQRSTVDVEAAIFSDEFGAEKFVDKIDDAYFDVVMDSGKTATREMNKKFGTNMTFTINVEKAEAAFVAPMVPVNEYSVKWMRERSLELVKDLGKQQRKVIQGALTEGFEQGLRAEEAYDIIKDNIGLTGRESGAVLNRQKLLEAQGFDEDKVVKLTDKYREQLLRKRAERIARTETIAADAAGRRQAWQVAQDTGSLPQVHRVWIAAPPSPNPFRPCEICIELDGNPAEVGGMYESALVGPVSGPGPDAHPS